MEWIKETYESVPSYVLLILIGVSIAIFIISAIKKHSLLGLVIVIVIIFLFFGTGIKDYFKDFDKEKVFNEDTIDNLEDKILEKDKSGFFERLFNVGEDSDENSNDDEEESDSENLQADEDSEFGDYVLEGTDLLLVAAKSEDEGLSTLLVHVYEPEEKNLYVHHDIMLSAYPLSLAWTNFPCGVDKESSGTMKCVDLYHNLFTL